MTRGDLTAEHLRDLLSYDADTGHFVWKVTVAQGVKAGRVAGSTSVWGYRTIQVLGRSYRAHRLAWLYVYGEWPSAYIDHINGNRSDNRIANLRDVPRNVNAQNQRRPQKNNKCGLLGVSWHSQARKWVAQIQRPSGGKKCLGLFETPEAAHEAYLATKRQMHEGCTL